MTVLWVSGGCKGIVWRVSGGCLAGVIWLSGGCLEGIYGMTEWYSGKSVTIHDKGDTRRGGEMYLPTMKVSASLCMKGIGE